MKSEEKGEEWLTEMEECLFYRKQSNSRVCPRDGLTNEDCGRGRIAAVQRRRARRDRKWGDAAEREAAQPAGGVWDEGM